MNLLVKLPLVGFIISFLPLFAFSGTTTQDLWCNSSKMEKMYKITPENVRRFFLPDCKIQKFIFQSDRQGCLGALRWLQEKIGPSKRPPYRNKLHKLISCTRQRCSSLPLFRRCGSNKQDHSNPRLFRNGCRQCATSCREVLAGRRRYERLSMDKCPRPTHRKPDKINTVESQPPQKTTKSPDCVGNKTTAAPEITTIYSTLVQASTSELLTTQQMTTEETITYKPQPIEKIRSHQYCTKHLTGQVACPSTTDPLSQVHLPELPPWRNG